MNKVYPICLFFVFCLLPVNLLAQGFNNDFDSESDTRPKADDEVYPDVKTPILEQAMRSNAAIGHTISTDMIRPNNIGDQKYLFLEPLMGTGVLVYPQFKGGMMIAFERAPFDFNNTLFSMAYGSADKVWGAGFKFSFDRENESSEPNDSTVSTISSKFLGDRMAVFGSYQFNGLDFFMSFDRVTFNQETKAENATVPAGAFLTYEEVNTENLIQLGLKKEVSHSSPHAVEVRLLYNLRSSHISSDDGLVTTDSTLDSASSDIGFLLNYGKEVENQGGIKILMGASVNFMLSSYNNRPLRTDSSDFRIALSPNVAIEYQIAKQWKIFGGGQYSLLYSSNSWATDNAGFTNNQSNSELNSLASQITVGAQYRFKRLSLESRISNTLFNDGPSRIFSGAGVLARTGLVITF